MSQEVQEVVEQAAEEIQETVSEETQETKEEPEPKGPTPEQVQEEIDGRFAALRRKERELSKYEASLSKQASDLKSQMEDIANLSQMMRSKPEEAWGELAKRGGLTEDEYLERVVERRVSGKPSEKELWQEMQLLRKELADKEAKEKKDAEDRAAQLQQTHVERAVQAATSDWCQRLATPEGQTQFKWLGNLKTEAIEVRVASAMWWATQNPSVPLEKIIETVDKMVEEEYSPHVSRLRKEWGLQDQENPEENPEDLSGSQNRAAPSRQPKTISNVSQAVRGARKRPMTHDERVAAAARYIPDPRS